MALFDFSYSIPTSFKGKFWQLHCCIEQKAKDKLPAIHNSREGQKPNKWKGTRSPEYSGSTVRGKVRQKNKRVEGKWEENLREQESQVGGRTKKQSRERDTLMEGATMDLTRNMTLGKSALIHKDDPNKVSNQQWKIYLKCPSCMRLMTASYAILKQEQIPTAKH